MVAAEVFQYTKQQVIKQHAHTHTIKMHVHQCSIYWLLTHYRCYVHFMTSGPSLNYISDESMIHIVSCQCHSTHPDEKLGPFYFIFGPYANKATARELKKREEREREKVERLRRERMKT